jgi:hypothetical protein
MNARRRLARFAAPLVVAVGMLFLAPATAGAATWTSTGTSAGGEVISVDGDPWVGHVETRTDTMTDRSVSRMDGVAVSSAPGADARGPEGLPSGPPPFQEDGRRRADTRAGGCLVEPAADFQPHSGPATVRFSRNHAVRPVTKMR